MPVRHEILSVSKLHYLGSVSKLHYLSWFEWEFTIIGQTVWTPGVFYPDLGGGPIIEPWVKHIGPFMLRRRAERKRQEYLSHINESTGGF